ncbi:unnamed protein product, partial [marine sediment metagenome]
NWESTIEFGDALKGAKSDALKVAAHELGLGLDLYWDDTAELAAWEDAQAQAEALAALAKPSEYPLNGVQFIARAGDELSLNVNEILEPLEIKMETLMAADKDILIEWWEKLKKLGI